MTAKEEREKHASVLEDLYKSLNVYDTIVTTGERIEAVKFALDFIHSDKECENEKESEGVDIESCSDKKIYIEPTDSTEMIDKSVKLLDRFSKTFCRVKDAEDLEFRCDDCPFLADNDNCLLKIFKLRYAPGYRNFGSMGDL